jgi:uncharacterized iron-regulated protein
MKQKLLLFTLLLIASVTLSQKAPYVIYNAKGKKVTYKKMLATLVKKDVVFFGEQHNNAISHWLQYEVTADLSTSRELILGAEMIESDNQEALNQYLSGEIDGKGLDSLARLWPNYKTDYAPLVDFAKANNLPFVATNIPRRYANMVYKSGFSVLDSLPAFEKAWIAPLPMPFDSQLPTYQNILAMMGDHGTPELVMAQASKDATMAHFLLKNYREGAVFLHFNGAYHSDDYEGILWYVMHENTAIDAATITTVSQDDVFSLLEENHAKADFIICVDSNMTTTY